MESNTEKFPRTIVLNKDKFTIFQIDTIEIVAGRKLLKAELSKVENKGGKVFSNNKSPCLN